MKALQWTRKIFTVDFPCKIKNVAKISAKKIFGIKDTMSQSWQTNVLCDLPVILKLQS